MIDISSINKKKITAQLLFFVIPAVAFLYSLLNSPRFTGYGYDKEVYRYMGMLIANGGTPYIDAFDHKPPLLYILNFLGFLLTKNSPLGIFIILNSIGSISALFVFRAMQKINSHKETSILLTICYIVLVNDHELLEGGNLTRQLTTYISSILISLVFLNKPNHKTLIVQGILLSFIFFTQQNEIIGLIPIIVYFSTTDISKHKGKARSFMIRISYIAIGFVIPTVLFLMLCIYWGNIHDFLYQGFIFNIKVYPLQGPWFLKTLMIVKFFIYKTNLLILLAISIFIHLINQKYKKNLSNLLFLGLVFQLISTSISGYVFGHYFLAFIPFIVFFSGSINDKNFKWINYSFWLSISFVIGISCFSLLSTPRAPVKTTKFLKEVASVGNRKGQFYPFETTYLGINNDLNILSPTKWIYPHFAYTDYFDPEGDIVKTIIKDINKSKTKYILIKKDKIKIDRDLNELLTVRYNPIIEENDLVLYKRIYNDAN